MAAKHLMEIEVTHDAENVFVVHGRFRHVRRWDVLARVGEGRDDKRSEETLRITANAVAEEIARLYEFDARFRDMEERKARRQHDSAAAGLA